MTRQPETVMNSFKPQLTPPCDSRQAHLAVCIDRKDFVQNGRILNVLGRVEFDVREGEFLSILGPSGCGKSTLLRIIGGLDTDYAGTIQLQGRSISGPDRDRGVVFQESRLLPWRTVHDNITFALPDGLTTREREARAERVLQLTGLSAFKHAWPKQLSGGMEKRVALARALVSLPEILLLDEPFAALDAFSRYAIQDEVFRVHAEEGTTTILVTHDVDEAAYLSDRVLVLSPSPARIRAVIPIEIGRPRSRTATEFNRLRSQLLDIVLQPL